MVSKKSAEARVTLYRLVGLKQLSSAIRSNYKQISRFERQEVEVGECPALLVTGKTGDKPVRWGDLLGGLSGTAIDLSSSVAAGLLIIKDDDSSESGTGKTNKESNGFVGWALSFGMGYQLLDQNHIDSGFGQRVVIRTPNAALNSINKTTLDERPQIVRSTITSGAPLRAFGFDELGELATRIVANATIEGIGDPKNPVTIRGADSLNLPLSKDPAGLINNLSQIKAVLEQPPASEEAAILDQLKLVPSGNTGELDQLLIDAIADKNDAKLRLTYPHELIDEYGTAQAYQFKGAGSRERIDHLPTLEEILEPLRQLDSETRKKKLNDWGIVLYQTVDSDEFCSPRIPLKKWLVYQAEIGEARYFLYSGLWYEMDRDYYDFAKRRTQEIFSRTSPIGSIPPWTTTHTSDKEADAIENSELKYNEKLANQLGGICLDQKLIRSRFHKRGIEACDVLLKDGTFIHVKRVEASAPASHLLAQALVSTEVLKYDLEARCNLKSLLDKLNADSENYELEPKRVVLVLVSDKKNLTADSLYTFTQVNLARQVTHFDRDGTKVFIETLVRNSKKQENDSS